MPISRRNALTAGVAAVAAPAVLSTPRTAAAPSLDLTEPANKLEVYARMRGNGDGELALWWWNANVWSKLNGDIPKVLMTVEGLTFQKVTRNADGTLNQKMAGRGTFRDKDTGEPLTSWTNPVNGKTAEPDHIVSLSNTTVAREGMVREDSDRVIEFEGGIGEVQVVGGNAYLTENFAMKTRGRYPGMVFTGASLTVFTADAALLADDHAAFRPCNMNYQSPGSFRPWIGFEDSDGIMTWQTYGQKLPRGKEDAPANMRAWVEENHPGFLDNPPI
jgi:hypothetical protein